MASCNPAFVSHTRARVQPGAMFACTKGCLFHHTQGTRWTGSNLTSENRGEETAIIFARTKVTVEKERSVSRTTVEDSLMIRWEREGKGGINREP